MSLLIKDLAGKEDIAIHCLTRELAEQVCNLTGVTNSKFWSDAWDSYKEMYCIYPFGSRPLYGELGVANEKGRLVIDASEFIKANTEWKLPEKWCVATVGHEKEIAEWLNANSTNNVKNYSASNLQEYVHYPSCDITHHDSYILSGYTQISYEQFEKYVLNKQTMMKNIIGYKVPYDIFGGRIKKGAIFSEYSNQGLVMYNKDHTTSGVATEIVKMWEAVYEEEKIKVLGYTSNRAGNMVEFGCYKFTKEQLQAYRHLLTQEGNYAKITVENGTQVVRVTVDIIDKLLKML